MLLYQQQTIKNKNYKKKKNDLSILNHKRQRCHTIFVTQNSAQCWLFQSLAANFEELYEQTA